MALSVPNFTTGGNSAAATSITAGAQATTTGNLLVVGFRRPTSANVSSVTDTAGNTFVKINGATSKANGATNVDFYFSKNITGNAANVVTISFNSSSFTAMAVWEVAGADPTWPLDTYTVASPVASGTTITSRTFSTSNANTITICMASTEATGETFTQGSGYTLDSGTFPTTVSSNYCGAQHQIFSSKQNSITANMTYTSSASSALSVVSFVGVEHTGRPVPVVNFTFGGQSGSTTSIPSGAINTTAANLLVVGLRLAAANMSTVTSVTDTAGNTYTSIPATLAVQGTSCSQLWYAKNITANAANVVTVALSAGSVNTVLAVWEVATANLTSPLDSTATGTAASGSTVTTGAFTTTLAKEVALAIGVDGSTTYAAGTNYTLDNGVIPMPNSAATPNFGGAQHQSFTIVQTGVTASMTYGISSASHLSLATFSAPTIATPTFNPIAGSYATAQSVTVSDTNSGLPGFAMYYTTDGSTPTTASTLYTGPVSINSSLTLKVLATSTGYNDSAIASAAYTIGGSGVGTTGDMLIDNRWCTRLWG